MNNQPQVGIIMGSDSDLNVMEAAALVLQEMGISLELTVVSAHRTPQRMINYASSAAHRGLKVIIAGAGGAAHLPGKHAVEEKAAGMKSKWPNQFGVEPNCGSYSPSAIAHSRKRTGF
jgi:phosphoribosylcarboxyaminoimidazole (NCAIR) mutase